MEFKHSPAPWMATKREFFIELYDDNGSYVGLTNSTANAHLIAAAPELLEVLRELIQSHEYLIRIGHERIIELGGDCDSPEIMITKDSSLNKAKAAIAKALGQQ